MRFLLHSGLVLVLIGSGCVSPADEWRQCGRGHFGQEKRMFTVLAGPLRERAYSTGSDLVGHWVGIEGIRYVITDWVGDAKEGEEWRPIMLGMSANEVNEWLKGSLLPEETVEDLLSGTVEEAAVGIAWLASDWQRGMPAVVVLRGRRYCLAVRRPLVLFTEQSVLNQGLWKLEERPRVSIDGRVCLEGECLGRVVREAGHWVIGDCELGVTPVWSEVTIDVEVDGAKWESETWRVIDVSDDSKREIEMTLMYVITRDFMNSGEVIRASIVGDEETVQVGEYRIADTMRVREFAATVVGHLKKAWETRRVGGRKSLTVRLEIMM